MFTNAASGRRHYWKSARIFTIFAKGLSSSLTAACSHEPDEMDDFGTSLRTCGDLTDLGILCGLLLRRELIRLADAYLPTRSDISLEFIT